MSRTSINFLLDTVLLLVIVAALWLRVVMALVFPPATLADGWTLWGWTYDHWASAHLAVDVVLAVGVLVHIMLHWSWVCGVAAHRLSQVFGRKITIDKASETVWGVGLLLFLCHLGAGLYLAALLSVNPPPTIGQ